MLTGPSGAGSLPGGMSFCFLPPMIRLAFRFLFPRFNLLDNMVPPSPLLAGHARSWTIKWQRYSMQVSVVYNRLVHSAPPTHTPRYTSDTYTPFRVWIHAKLHQAPSRWASSASGTNTLICHRRWLYKLTEIRLGRRRCPFYAKAGVKLASSSPGVFRALTAQG